MQVVLHFADDDNAVDIDGGQHRSHGVHRCPVDRILVTPSLPLGRGNRRRFGHPHHVEREIAIWFFRHRSTAQ